jgi:viroplasmin and RNaseH domain-containing protein
MKDKKKVHKTWGETKIGIKGYFVGLFSRIQQYDTARQRSKDDRHIFFKESQAIGSISLSVLTQQLADFNEGWVPEWWDDDKTKFCIVNDFRGGCGEFKVVQGTTLYRFLAFKTKEDAEEFLEVNRAEIYLARDFI